MGALPYIGDDPCLWGVTPRRACNRLGRRLPISKATADVVIAQQQRVRERFPDTPETQLRLLPTKYRNPDGRKAISRTTLQARHRDWLATLPTLRTRDGIEFDKSRVVPYGYRHTYAQRHADAGVPIDLLAELLESMTTSQRYVTAAGSETRSAAAENPLYDLVREVNQH